MEENIHIKSIAELHSQLGIAKPNHPLVSVIPAAELAVPREHSGTTIIQDYYMVSLKDKSCGAEYGRKSTDFGEGVLTFLAPGQVYRNINEIQKGQIQGHILYFHPNFIRHTRLGKYIANYSFFYYSMLEALHLSREEEHSIEQCMEAIRSDLVQSKFNESATISKLEALLKLCNQYYERQFQTRSARNQEILSQFEQALQQYFINGSPLEKGVPSVEYFSERLHLSRNYFGDLIKRETGKSPKDFINEIIVEQAKQSLLKSNRKVREIAYHLGFNYPHYFTRLFKSKTGYTPLEYRNVNLNQA